MTAAEIERVYEALAETIDAEGAERAEITLAKICLALAHRVGDADAVLESLAACRTPDR